MRDQQQQSSNQQATAQYYSLSNANSRLSNADSSTDQRTLNASRPYGVIKAPSFNIATQSFRYSRQGFPPVTSGFPIFQFFGKQFFSLYTAPVPRVVTSATLCHFPGCGTAPKHGLTGPLSLTNCPSTVVNLPGCVEIIISGTCLPFRIVYCLSTRQPVPSGIH